ncbi:MAG: PTS sugar transporter subunit IIA [Gammaproteobacteria bacterium]
MNLQALISAERVCVDIAARSKKHLIELAAHKLAPCFDDVTANQLFDAMIARERLGCTALGRGIALPHATVATISKPAACVLKLREPVRYGDDDEGLVTMVFALVVPSATQGVDNDILQHACDVLSRGERRRALLAADSEQALFDALAEPDDTPGLREATG